MVYVMQIGIAFLGQETHDDYGHAKKRCCRVGESVEMI